ncbi:MAG: SDR family NAD(P)-dependent oxidoreductase [Candidatus Poseidoniaceae archaeon]|jgi:nucleoside-diphosphate-sugar epimerase
MSQLLITGGAGFIGSNFAKTSINRGWKVRILDKLSTGLQSIADELELNGAEIIIGDIRDELLLDKAIEGCDAVVHLAAQVSVPLSVSNPEETMSINVDGTSKVIAACLKHGVKRLVIASSAAVYGEAESLPLKEEDAGQVLSPYAESKWENETQIIDARKKGLQATALRFFNVYGDGQRPDGAYAAVIPKFADMMAQGIVPQINGDGLQTRDFVHVHDVCEAIYSLIEGDWKADKFHVYNVATQTKITLLELVEAINTSLSSFLPDYIHISPAHGPERVGDIRHSMASIERIQSTLDWSPKVGFEEGIKGLLQERLNLN